MLFEVDQAEIAHTNYCRNSNPPGHFGTPEFSSCSAPLPSPNLVYSARMGENWNWNVMLGHWHGLCGLACHIIDAPFRFGEHCGVAVMVQYPWHAGAWPGG